MAPPALDTRALRSALGCFATGVTVVTTLRGDEVVAMVVNSFTSVSLDPPLVLWCVGAASRRYSAFRHAEAYVISVLGSEHARLCADVIGNAEHVGDHLEATLSGPPAVAGAAAVFECRAHDAIDHGDHALLIGRVVAFHANPEASPLIFHQGRLDASSGAARAAGAAR